MTAPAPTLLLLGPVMLESAGGSIRLTADRRSQLLVRLALQPREWFERDRLAALMWPEHALAEARRNLRKVIFKGRELAGSEALEATEQALRWNAATDVQTLQQCLAPATEAQRLIAAVALWRGPPLTGLDDAANPLWCDWLRDERSRLLSLWQQVAHMLLACTEPADAREALARQLLRADGLDETAMLALIEVQLAAGRGVDAQRSYRDYAARLADELGVEPSSALSSRIAAPGAKVTSAAPQPVAADGASLSVDRSASSLFIGRRLELQALQRLFVDEGARLVTLGGPGGIGKSRLAKQWLAGNEDVFSAGRHWIELEDLSDGAHVPARIAQRLSLVLPDGEPVQALSRALGAGRRMLLLDNAEHLPDLAALLDGLLDASPALSLLVTSRVRLNARHEQLLTLAGLDAPDELSHDLEAAAAFDAVRLFVQRAAAAQPGFSLQRQLPAVIDIVVAVGGLPLAIELAASWVRLLPPAEIADDLRESIELLQRDAARGDTPARPEHTSMQVVLARSLQLLAPREREALLSLAVFRGGFTAQAAREVAAVPLPLLSSLLDNSMLQLDDGGRFAMHPLLAREALARAQAEPAALQKRRLRHAAYYARRLVALVGQHRGEPRLLVQTIEAELANGELAWQQAVAAGLHDVLRQGLPAWRAYFVACGRFAQSVRHFEQALEAEGPPDLRARLKAALAYFLIRHRAPERAVALAAEALTVAEQIDDTMLAQECIAVLGGGRMVLGQWADAHAWLQRALALAERLGAVRDVASAHGNLGLSATHLNRFDEAREHFRQAIQRHHELGNQVGVARAMCNLAFVDVARGAWRDAVAPLHDARRFALEHGVKSVAPETVLLLGAAQVEDGEFDAAEQHFLHCREDFRALGNAGFVLKCDYYLARIAGRRGAPDDAAPVLLQALRQSQAEGWVYDVLYVSAFIAEALHTKGHAQAAALLLASARAAPHADTSVRAVVDACLQRDGVADADVVPFGVVLGALEPAVDLADAAMRLSTLLPGR